MSKDLKVGERVAVYDGNRKVGCIDAISTDPVRVRIDCSGVWFHPKQCRRLRKKARREFKLKPNGQCWCEYDGTKDRHCYDGCKTIVREVRGEK